jgi:hypothetical protein
MDLTKSFPRSVRDKIAGLAQAPRTTDKARAKLAGTLGEYHYDCPMDRHLFEYLGTNAGEFLEVVRSSSGDSGVETFVRAKLAGKPAGDAERWNAEWFKYGPQPGSESHGYFMDLRGQVAPGRTDVTSWADLLDLDEGRPVPQRVGV